VGRSAENGRLIRSFLRDHPFHFPVPETILDIFEIVIPVCALRESGSHAAKKISRSVNALAFSLGFHENGPAEIRLGETGPGRELNTDMQVREVSFLFIGWLILLVGGCSGPAVRPAAPPQPPQSKIPQAKTAETKPLPRLGYTIQAGAFANAENAARLTRSLQEKGLDATYFVARQGLYKVRFGNFPSKEQARARADEMQNSGIIDEFYVIGPEEYTVSRREARGETYVREELVRSARSFLGVPYLWGGASAGTGFDCSGLTMTVYQLNGLDLPRTSREQFGSGSPVDRSSLAKGDLIFFADKGDKISHVGIYAGDGLFIHAPGKGRKIRTDPLAKEYYSRTFIGARSYL
jgi:cell wall-associated NlpC family hydrolase